jgi:hypothetical protein
MTQKTKPAETQTAPPRREIYYKTVRFTPDFVMALGQSYSTTVGNLVCSTKAKPSQYSARWVPGSGVLSIKWKTAQGDIVEYDVPWARVMGATRIPEGDEPAPLK